MHGQRRIVLLQEHFPHYRTAFARELDRQLAGLDIECEWICGKRVGVSQLASNSQPGRIARVYSGFGLRYLARGSFPMADLVIVPQQVKFLNLYVELARRLSSHSTRLALWGHGRNFQATIRRAAPEWIKRQLSVHCDWWFAYNDLSARVVAALGFPKSRITSVQNSIDTRGIAAARQALGDSDLTRVRMELGLRDTARVAIFTGGLYREKRVAFLLEACALIRKLVPDFHLIVIGGGPHAKFVERAALESSWIHQVGPKDDIQKVAYWAISDVLLMPGLVGLVVLDSFVLGVPMVTTAYPYHSPEIDYLEDGRNGIIVREWRRVEAYARAVAELLADSDRLRGLATNARRAGVRYSAENMAERFATGIAQALEAPRRRILPVLPGLRSPFLH